MPSTELSAPARAELMSLARRAIERVFERGALTPLDVSIRHPELLMPGATFVTLLECDTRSLRGCCGTLEARQPLAEDVWHNARASAFADPRFPALTRTEWSEIELHISVLSPPIEFRVASGAELLASLRPGVDGLVVEYGAHRATFLPSVWEQLPEPREFVRRLLAKARLQPDFWSPQLRWFRYAVQEFGDEVSS